jgi:2-polyprenyl-6-methoxyphenol hydroxylase-like FAD-dependent oxidoreductase
MKARLRGSVVDLLRSENPAIRSVLESCEVASADSTVVCHLGRVDPPARPRVVLLGDALHVIDPTIGEGLRLALLEVELMRDVHLPRWFRVDDFSAASLSSFYQDSRLRAAESSLFAFGRTTFDYYRGTSLLAALRRTWKTMAWKRSWRTNREVTQDGIEGASPWGPPQASLYAEYEGLHAPERPRVRDEA